MSDFIYLPFPEAGSERVGFVRKAVAELVGPELDYYTKLEALGPRPDKDVDGSIEYDTWHKEARAIAQAYLSQL